MTVWGHQHFQGIHQALGPLVLAASALAADQRPPALCGYSDPGLTCVLAVGARQSHSTRHKGHLFHLGKPP